MPRSLAGSVMNCQGGLEVGSYSEVRALHIAINQPRGFDLFKYGDLNWLPRDTPGYAVSMEVART